MMLSPHFAAAELACRCGCGFGEKDEDVDLKLIELLEYMRVESGEPIIINSGCRCLTHNFLAKGSENSAHLRGGAADISCIDSTKRWLLINAALKWGCKRIGIGSSFVHVDVDETLPQRRVWTY